jgi:hypothetical protein
MESVQKMDQVADTAMPIRQTLAEIAALPAAPASLRAGVGPLTVNIRFHTQAFAVMFASAFAVPLPPGPADYRLDALSGSASLYRPRMIPQDMDTDIHASAGQQSYALWFGRFSHAIHLVDRPAAAAAYWIDDADAVPAWERARPFLPAFQAMLAPTDWLGVHGAGIAWRGRGILLAGRGKAGKTSLSLAALSAGWRFTGDDFILMDSATPEMAPLYATARLRADMAPRFAALRSATEREISHDEGDKRHELSLGNLEHKADIGGAPVAAILLLDRRGSAKPTFSPVSRTAVLSAIASTTRVVTPGDEAGRVEKLIRLLGHVTPLRFDPGPDFSAALAALKNLVA